MAPSSGKGNSAHTLPHSHTPTLPHALHPSPVPARIAQWLTRSVVFRCSAGIPAGGVSAFIDRLKTQEERDRYDRVLGTGMGGVPNIAIDPCYHQRCDTVANINTFAFEQIGKANGAVLEQLARMTPQALKTLMFPQLAEGEHSPRYEPREWPIGEEQQYE